MIKYTIAAAAHKLMAYHHYCILKKPMKLIDKKTSTLINLKLVLIAAFSRLQVTDKIIQKPIGNKFE